MPGGNVTAPRYGDRGAVATDGSAEKTQNERLPGHIMETRAVAFTLST